MSPMPPVREARFRQMIRSYGTGPRVAVAQAAAVRRTLPGYAPKTTLRERSVPVICPLRPLGCHATAQRAAAPPATIRSAPPPL